MKLIVLCVDGLDPDYARELGFPKMPYESKLKIQKELYFDGTPITQLVWPSMLSGRIVKTKPPSKVWLSNIRLPVRKFLHKHGIRWKRKKRTWVIDPVNINIESVSNKYNSIMWNFPTICPEFISTFPTPEDILRYGRREYQIWKMITYGMCLYPYDLSIAYCHLPDFLGHQLKPLENVYLDIHHHAKRLSKRRSVMLVSDHGCVDGEHTDHAYLGCTEPIEAKNVLEVRNDIERILDSNRKHNLCT